MPQFDIATACCFAGHRPSKMPFGYLESDKRCIMIKKMLKNYVKIAIQHGYRHFISGMALGFDMWAAEAVLELKAKYPYITLECAIPCELQTFRWPRRSVERYHYILKRADSKEILSKYYTRESMFVRNRYMVDHASLLIALFDGTAGGTQYTVQYAKEKQVNTIIIPMSLR